MWPVSRRLVLMSALGLLIVLVLGGLGLMVGHAGSGSGASARGLAVELLGALAVSAVIALALLMRLLVRGEELRRANRTLAARNRELEQAGETRARFVANLAHELRNPLAAVLGYAELMGCGRFGALDERQHQHLEVIRESGDHLLCLVEELLDISQVEAGHLRLEGAPVSPAAVLRGCVAALQTAADERQVRLEIDADAAGLVMLDPTRLRQVILNYLSNAIKFSPVAGRVVARLRAESGGLRVEVSDAGPGLSAGDQARVFDEFFQVPGRDRSGTGLGLAVTRLIVEAQGGRVAVRSLPGAGSTFSAWLPAPAVPAATAGLTGPGPRPAAPVVHRRTAIRTAGALGVS